MREDDDDYRDEGDGAFAAAISHSALQRPRRGGVVLQRLQGRDAADYLAEIRLFVFHSLLPTRVASAGSAGEVLAAVFPAAPGPQFAGVLDGKVSAVVPVLAEVFGGHDAKNRTILPTTPSSLHSRRQMHSDRRAFAREIARPDN